MAQSRIINSPGGYLVFDIGCIECGVESCPVGFYNSREEAEQVANDYITQGHHDSLWHGQHSVEVFEL